MGGCAPTGLCGRRTHPPPRGDPPPRGGGYPCTVCKDQFPAGINLGQWPSPHSRHQCTLKPETLVIIPMVTAMVLAAHLSSIGDSQKISLFVCGQSKTTLHVRAKMAVGVSRQCWACAVVLCQTRKKSFPPNETKPSLVSARGPSGERNWIALPALGAHPNSMKCPSHGLKQFFCKLRLLSRMRSLNQKVKFGTILLR